MADSVRPKHVVVVDAENPLAEVRGEFYWREDHERIVAQEREAAYRDGYAGGWAAASARALRQRIVVRRRRPLWLRILARLFLAYMVIAMTLVVLAILVEEFTPLL